MLRSARIIAGRFIPSSVVSLWVLNCDHSVEELDRMPPLFKAIPFVTSRRATPRPWQVLDIECCSSDELTIFGYFYLSMIWQIVCKCIGDWGGETFLTFPGNTLGLLSLTIVLSRELQSICRSWMALVDIWCTYWVTDWLSGTFHSRIKLLVIHYMVMSENEWMY